MPLQLRSGVYHRIAALLVLCSLDLLGGCAEPSLRIGRTAGGLDLALRLSPSAIQLAVGDELLSPLAVVSISADVVQALRQMNYHSTYLEIVDHLNNQRHVFSLSRVGDSVEVETQYHSTTRVINDRYATVVTIDADEVTAFLRHEANARAKPQFPNTPWRYFLIWRSIHLDWSVHGFWDVILDLVYLLFLPIVGFVDLVLIVATFAGRLVVFGFIVAVYLITSPFQ